MAKEKQIKRRAQNDVAKGLIGHKVVLERMNSYEETEKKAGKKVVCMGSKAIASSTNAFDIQKLARSK